MATFAVLGYVLSATSLMLIGLGLRGRRVLTSPRCARCGFDLRALNFLSQDPPICTECGGNLAKNGAVHFGVYHPDFRIIAVSLAVAALGGVLLVSGNLRKVSPAGRPVMIAGYGVYRSPSGYLNPATQPLSSIVQDLKSNPAITNYWYELGRRVDQKLLTSSETEEIVQLLIAQHRNNSSGGATAVRTGWAAEFIAKAVQARLVQPASLRDLIDASNEPFLRIVGHPIGRVNTPMVFGVHATNPRLYACGQVVWSLAEVTVDDGRVLEVAPYYWGQRNFVVDPVKLSGMATSVNEIQIRHLLPEGQHELQFHIDAALLAYDTISYIRDHPPGPKERWPMGYATWEMVIKLPITIVPAEQPIIRLVQEADRDPLKTQTIEIQNCTARQKAEYVQFDCQWKASGTASIPQCYRVDFLVAGERLHFGFLHLTKEGMLAGWNTQRKFSAFDPKVDQIDVVLTPSPEDVEQDLRVDEIWGKPIMLKGIPVKWIR